MTATIDGDAGSSGTGSCRRARCSGNPTTSQLYTHALARGNDRLAEGGPLVVDTGRFTGRSPQDKFVVREPGSEARIWWGDVNRPIEEASFDGLRREGRRPPRRPGEALRDRRVRRRRSRAPDRGAGRHREPVPRALREDDVHPPDRRGARRARAPGARAPCARGRGRPGGRRHADAGRSSCSTRPAARW